MTDTSNFVFAWEKIAIRILSINRDHLSSSAFIAETLRILKSDTGCLSAGYFHCTLTENSVSRIVLEAFEPTVGPIHFFDKGNFNVFDVDLLLPENKKQCFHQPEISYQGSKYNACVVQIRLGETGECHTLCLIFVKSGRPIEATQSEQEAMFTFLEFLAHIVNSKHLAGEEAMRRSRLEAVRSLLAWTGNVKEMAEKICQVWRKWLGVSAVRLWVLNSEFNELDLLYICSDKQYESNLKKAGNRLQSQSLGAQAIKDRRAIRTDNPAGMTEWSKDSAMDEVFKRLPHLICIPVISADRKVDEETPRFSGLIDLHVENLDAVREEDGNLFWVGTITAAAFLRARSYERHEMTKKLNEITIKLVNPKDHSRLNERKDEYLKRVIAIIKKAVQANCVSIFEADDARDTIRCVATTGIRGHQHPDRSVRYRKENDGLAWRVFDQGIYEVLTNQKLAPDYQGRFPEKRLFPGNQDLDPLLVFPLPGQTPQGSTGVIRILEKKCPVDGTKLQNFSDHDVDLIRLIAYQVSPSLTMIRMQSHRERFAQRTAHQVIQPLQGVIAYANNLIEGVYDDDPVKKLQKIRYMRQMAKAAAGMMRSTMWAAGITDFGFLKSVTKYRESLGVYFMERVIDLQPIRHADDIKVRFVNSREVEDWDDFWVDEHFFDHAVQNLLHNALKYSYPKTTILLGLQKVGRELQVSITSTGVPIEDPERIFWDRERGKAATKYDPHGTGQGLYIARQIMEGFGGRVVLLQNDDDATVIPPPGFPKAQRSTFQIIYPEAF